MQSDQAHLDLVSNMLGTCMNGDEYQRNEADGSVLKLTSFKRQLGVRPDRLIGGGHGCAVWNPVS
jgi:hypothetical protein